MKVLVYGASTNPSRYAYIATELLLQHGHEVSLVGIKKGEVLGLIIQQDQPLLQDIDTVTLYVGPANQEGLLAYLSAISPRRVIFNPGTENPELERGLEKMGIQTEEACTLVLLHTGQF
ncbi:CoA-binding protein [Aquirufa antheringensis]|jgi:predicted CoA-binding protein|uniref:CoA-binding protein n=1 Tax=Aquirufa antheringensis TaxID=2516559 RepID=UPI0030A595B7|nr:CoA-binding protein [Aquirufa antheringensis]